MTINNEIEIELWNAIEKNYCTENYTGAIRDAIFILTDTIRNKSGLEGDGVNLVGQAFGGDNPRIKLNKLQTDSERDEQKGILEMLKGLYTAIRNPRSHDMGQDSKETADAIIVFINYLLGVIDKSKLSFNEEKFFGRVFDQYFVKSKEYSDLLVNEIPKRQRANIAISTIQNREKGEIYAVGCFLSSLFEKLDEADLDRVISVISEELETTTDDTDIRWLIHILPGKYWKKIKKAARIRIESILYDDFSKGRYCESSGRCYPYGALATWITGAHLINFDRIYTWTGQAVDMIKSDNKEKSDYIDRFFWEKICDANKEHITWPLKNYFIEALKIGEEEIIEKLKDQIIWEKDHPWWKVFEDELAKYPDIKYDEEALPF